MKAANKHSKQIIHYAPASILSCRQRKIEKNIDNHGRVTSEGVTTRDITTLRDSTGNFMYGRLRNGAIVRN